MRHKMVVDLLPTGNFVKAEATKDVLFLRFEIQAQASSITFNIAPRAVPISVT